MPNPRYIPNHYLRTPERFGDGTPPTDLGWTVPDGGNRHSLYAAVIQHERVSLLVDGIDKRMESHASLARRTPGITKRNLTAILRGHAILRLEHEAAILSSLGEAVVSQLPPLRHDFKSIHPLINTSDDELHALSLSANLRAATPSQMYMETAEAVVSAMAQSRGGNSRVTVWVKSPHDVESRGRVHGLAELSTVTLHLDSGWVEPARPVVSGHLILDEIDHDATGEATQVLALRLLRCGSKEDEWEFASCAAEIKGDQLLWAQPNHSQAAVNWLARTERAPKDQTLGAYAAKQCVVKAQLDVLKPSKPLPPPAELQLRMERGDDFEKEVYEQLLRHGAIDAGDDPATTLEAMNQGARIIVGAELPNDVAGQRAGRPDILVRDDQEPIPGARWGYSPIDVKHHRTAEPSGSSTKPWLSSPLSSPTYSAASLDSEQTQRRSRDDAIQLAHYRRMLEACGHASAATWAGVVGREERVSWYDLEEISWLTPAKSDGLRRRHRSIMEIYDFEFGFRLKIADTAARHTVNGSVALLVEPRRTSECATCGWREECAPVLENESGDTSLLPSMTYPTWRSLRDIGIRSRRDLLNRVPQKVADLCGSLTAAQARKVNQEIAGQLPNSALLSDVFSTSQKLVANLTEHDISTLGELRSHGQMLEVLGGKTALPRHVRDAAASLDDRDFIPLADPIPRWPRADIEVDIDMENTIDDRVYLWGALVDADHPGIVSGYRPFVDWALQPQDRLER